MSGEAIVAIVVGFSAVSWFFGYRYGRADELEESCDQLERSAKLFDEGVKLNTEKAAEVDDMVTAHHYDGRAIALSRVAEHLRGEIGWRKMNNL